MDPTLSPRRSLSRILPFLIATITFCAFLPALRGQFLYWDDDLNFLDNPRYRGFSLEHLKWIFTTFHMGHWHPLTWLTLALDYVVWGMNPFGYHLTALILHSTNAAILYLVLRAFFRRMGRPDTLWPAAIGALLYGLHPQRVESVAWITERRDVLCGLFTLLCVLAYLRHAEEERGGRPSRRWLVLSVVAFAASLLSKALSITLPAVLLLLDVFPLGRFTPGSRLRVTLEKVPYVLLSCADAAVMMFAMRSINAVHQASDYRFLARAAQAAYGLCFYPLKLLWPHPLLPIYPIDPAMKPSSPVYLLAIAGVIGITGTLIAIRKRWPAGLAAWAAYGILVLPVLGVAVTGMQIAADRYTYLSLIPVSVLIAAGLDRATGGRRTLPLFAAAAAWLIALAAVSWHQCRYWRDSIALWDHQIAYVPRFYFPMFSRATAKMNGGDLDGALVDYDAALILNPLWETTWMNRGTLHAVRGEPAAAVSDFNRAIELDPKYAEAYVRRAISRAKLGDAAGATADLEIGIGLHPESPTGYSARGNLRLDRGDLRNAIADYDRSLAIDRASPDVYRNRGLAKFRSGRPAEAIADYNRSLDLRPDHVDTLTNRALARSLAGDPDGGLADLSTAIRLRSDPGLFVSRATIRGMKGDLPGAITDLSEAVRLKPDLADAYARRGMAYLEMSRKPDAVRDLEKALDLYPARSPQRAAIEEALRRARNP
jgi:tetratricopeptide (TPR) repeat protein